jgi:large subunit ribosomal protein L24
MKIKKGDKVKVIYGKDEGKEGVVERAYRKQNTIIIPGINVYKRHIRKSEKMPKGGIVDVPRPLDIAKVMVICPKCKKAVRIGWNIEGNKKLRICKRCASSI